MSFLSAAFLLALPLVAVPIAIHLYRGRQRDVIHWGAMQFLASAVTKGRSMERLEELLLMLLRAFAVAALVFALARPMVRSSLLGLGADREVILLLDNSLSMSREVGGESPADRLKEEALKVIDSLGGSDAVQVMLGVGGEWATAEGIAANSAGQRQLREIIEEVEPTLGAADLLGSLQSAIHLASDDELLGRRIVVITDGQASSWRTDAAAAWEQLADARRNASYSIVIEVVDCGPLDAEVDNLAVTEVKAARTLLLPGEPLALTAEIGNFGEVEVTDTTVEWLLDGRVLERTPVAGPLGRRAQTQVTTTVQIDDVGVFLVSCRLQGFDQVPLDQEAGLVIEVADRLPVLFVRDDRELGTSVTAAEFFAAALGYVDGQPRDGHSVFEPTVISPAELADYPLGNCRAVVINGTAELDRATIDRLEAYVRGGGGLWLALGEGAQRETFNRDWYADGDGLCPLPIESLRIIEDAEDVAATIHPPTGEHTATLQLANTTQLDIIEARIAQRWRFGARPESGEAVSTLLDAGNGEPLVVENYVGRGRVLVQSFPLGLEWSNLPVLKVYVVMIRDWLGYVTAPTTARYNLLPGASIVASPPEESPNATAELTTPRGRAIALLAADAEIGSVFRYSRTHVPGPYQVRFTSGDELLSELPYYVARDARESNLARLDEADRGGLLAAAGVQFAGQTTNSAPAAAEMAPRREPVWGALLAALVALLAGELLLANRLSRQRHSFSVSMG